MKYGLITYKNMPIGRSKGTKKGDHAFFNIGDNIQMMAVRRIYKEELHISDKDIIEIDFHDLRNYCGEYVVVLINLFFFGCHDMKETWFPASPYIIPIFVGVHFSSGILTDKECLYLGKYAPIGCRDEFTLSTMRRYGIDSYLYGCITATFPRRSTEEERGTIFLVDVDEKIISRMPQELRRYKIEPVNHVIEGMFSEETYRDVENLAEDLIEKYEREAVLVITSRMHCASPCVAMGIPTIMIVEERSQRISWLSNLINIYSINELDKINWNPGIVDFEPIKEKMINVIKDRIADVINKYENITQISNFFEIKEHINEFARPFQAFFDRLDKLLLLDNDVTYYVWGGTALAEEAIYRIRERNSSWKLCGIIDEYNDFTFCGMRSTSFSDLGSINNNSLFIITPTSSKDYISSVIEEARIKMGRVLFADGDEKFL